MWQDTLIEVFNAAFPVSKAMAAHGLTAGEAWEGNEVRVPREKLVATLTRSGLREELLQVGQELRAMHGALLSKASLSAPELIKLGVLSAAAQLLSGEALSAVEQADALFHYTMTNLLPWLQRLAQHGLLPLGSGLTGDASLRRQSSRAIHPTGDLVSRDLTDEEALLADLVQTTRMLTEILHQRARARFPAESGELA